MPSHEHARNDAAGAGRGTRDDASHVRVGFGRGQRIDRGQGVEGDEAVGLEIIEKFLGIPAGEPHAATAGRRQTLMHRFLHHFP